MRARTFLYYASLLLILSLSLSTCIRVYVLLSLSLSLYQATLVGIVAPRIERGWETVTHVGGPPRHATIAIAVSLQSPNHPTCPVKKRNLSKGKLNWLVNRFCYPAVIFCQRIYSLPSFHSSFPIGRIKKTIFPL